MKGGDIVKRMLSAVCTAALCLMMTVFVQSVFAETSGLISLLTDQLGITDTQAEGGSGALLRYAKQKLSTDDFSKVAGAMPETETLIKAAPPVEGLAAKLGSASSLLGGGEASGAVSSMAVLTKSFSSLGLDSGMIGKFVPIILEYAQGKGGGAVSSILKSVLP